MEAVGAAHDLQPLARTAERQQVQRLKEFKAVGKTSSAQAELQQVDAALRRLASGRYTTCAVCGEDIEPERLGAVPYTDRCRACAEGGRRSAGRDARG